MMEAVVLAGGQGSRLRDAVPDLPKAMAPIGGKPFLDLLLQWLARKGFGRVVLSVGYKSEVIMSHFGDSFAGMELKYAVETEPLGTGGGTRLALGLCTADHAFVFNGDTFVELEVERLEREWQVRQVPIIVGRHVPDTARFGRLRVQGDCVSGFEEKGAAGPGLINAGCYVLSAHQLDEWPVGSRFSLESDFFARAIAREHVGIFTTGGLFIDIGVPDDYRRAQVMLGHVR